MTNHRQSLSPNSIHGRAISRTVAHFFRDIGERESCNAHASCIIRSPEEQKPGNCTFLLLKSCSTAQSLFDSCSDHLGILPRPNSVPPNSHVFYLIVHFVKCVFKETICFREEALGISFPFTNVREYCPRLSDMQSLFAKCIGTI